MKLTLKDMPIARTLRRHISAHGPITLMDLSTIVPSVRRAARQEEKQLREQREIRDYGALRLKVKAR